MDEMLRTISRIYNTEDGKDFVAFLRHLSKETYTQWKKSPSEMNDIFKGQLIATDELVKVFEEADYKLQQAQQEEPIINPLY